MKGLKRVALWRRLRCALGTHTWTSQTTLNGYAIVFCGRCHELTVARFVDVPAGDMFGAGPEAGKAGPLGDLETGRAALAYVAGLVDGDPGPGLRARQVLTARPGAGVDAMAVYAAILLRILRSENGTDWVERFDFVQHGNHDLAALFMGLGLEEEPR